MDEKGWEGLSSGAEKVESIERAAAAERMMAKQRVDAARARMKDEAEKQKARRQGGSATVNGSAGSSGFSGNGANSANVGNGGNGANGGNGGNGANGGNQPEPRKQKKGKKRGDGLGGWIAAVVSLGAITLVLSARFAWGVIMLPLQADTGVPCTSSFISSRKLTTI